jgi:hypothetical protein
MRGETEMSDNDRARLREKQDRLLDLAARMGMALDLQISADAPGSPTLRDLATYVFQEWEYAIDSAIEYLSCEADR